MSINEHKALTGFLVFVVGLDDDHCRDSEQCGQGGAAGTDGSLQAEGAAATEENVGRTEGKSLSE